jgi:hypothetical protein
MASNRQHRLHMASNRQHRLTWQATHSIDYTWQATDSIDYTWQASDSIDNKNTYNIWSANDSVNNTELVKGSKDNIKLKAKTALILQDQIKTVCTAQYQQNIA